MELEGKVALVLGAIKGIGKEIGWILRKDKSKSSLSEFQIAIRRRRTTVGTSLPVSPIARNRVD